MICGDFNSEPNSAVYELLTEGQLNTHHPELEQHSEHAVHILPDQSEIYHSLDLASAIGGVMGSEPLFTNYTAMFKGTLDYIFYNPQRLYVTSCTNLPSAQEIQSTSGEGLPSACYPSDHLLQGVEVILTMSGSVNRHGGHHGGGGGGGGHHHGRASLR
jgi:CCR4-NOT transcription complex subunit 6